MRCILKHSTYLEHQRRSGTESRKLISCGKYYYGAVRDTIGLLGGSVVPKSSADRVASVLTASTPIQQQCQFGLYTKVTTGLEALYSTAGVAENRVLFQS